MSSSQNKLLRTVVMALVAIASMTAGARAATTFTGAAGTQWWYNPMNWSAGLVPPNNTAGAVTDTWISINTGFTGDLGAGVVYDPSPNDPGWAAAQTATYPAGFGPQKIQQLYVTRAESQPAPPEPQNPPLLTNMLTIKGSLEATIGQIGRSSGVAGVTANARVNQLAGNVVITSTLEIGGADTSRMGNANAIWDYRGGTLSVSPLAGNALRLSHGSTSVNAAYEPDRPTGPGGVGRLIIHNPATSGYIRVGNANLASFAGVIDSPEVLTNELDPDGVTSGVAILEYVVENGGTRPMQVTGNLSINNGFMATTGGTRSSRLALTMNGPVTLNAGVPINLGLIDVDFDNPAIPDDDFTVGILQGSGTLGSTFSTADGATQLAEGAMVSGIFGSTKYNWMLTYVGEITWADVETGALTSVAAIGGKDVVLVGVSSETVVVDNANFDGDTDVDGADFLKWQRNVSLAGQTTNANGDANGDGTVNGADLGVWRTQFGTTPPGLAAAGAVPEPGSVALLAAAALALCAARRRQ